MVLSNSLSCATVVVGAIAAGGRIVSIPPPPRGADLAWYARFVAASCAQTGATTLVVDASYMAMLPPLLEVTYSSYEEILRTQTRGRLQPERFVLTQFTSGNTGDPRGIVLGQDKLLATVEAIAEWLAPSPGDGVCSWYPLSHPMGLIGMFLTGLAGSGAGWANGGDIVLLSPEMFLRRPACWLEACAEFQSTITSGAPNFGLEMAVKRRPSGKLDLSSIRVCITGAEPIRTSTLEGFAAAFAATGFSDLALCPAFGLAESALVTATPRGTRWAALRLDPAALGERRVVPDDLGFPVVSAGRPLPGYDVLIANGCEFGEIVVGAPAIADVYADGTHVTGADGRMATGDLGFLADGNLYVVGRQDDFFLAAGREIYAVDLETLVAGVPGIRPGRVVAMAGHGGELWIAAEHDEVATTEPDGIRRLTAAVADRVGDRLGQSPQTVAIVPRGQMPLSLSGKAQRFKVAMAMRDGRLPTIHGA